jgi:hypothetical protein
MLNLSNAKPPMEEDVLNVYAVVEGWQNETLSRKEYYNAFYPIEIEKKNGGPFPGLLQHQWLL